MAKIGQEDLAEKLATTAELMVRLRSTYKVETTLASRYGVSRRTARRWVAKVRAMRRAEASDVDVESLRDEMRESLNTVVALAFSRTQVVKNDDGTVVLDRNGKPVVRANPDLQKALHGLRELMHLDGLAGPVKHQIKVDADVNTLPDLKKLGPDAAKHLEGFLRTIAPDADVGKLAGEWFSFAGESATKK